jgi:hypothetical protein
MNKKIELAQNILFCPNKNKGITLPVTLTLTSPKGRGG